MLTWFRYAWIASRGYRWRPWKSSYLRWRIETFSGIHADQIDFKTFWKFLWTYRRELAELMRWTGEMRKTGHESVQVHRP